MGQTADILYAFDEKYAPFAGVSLFSLLQTNRETKGLRILLATDGIGKEDRRRFAELARQFGRELRFLEADGLRARIQAAGVPAYRGSLAASTRLFWPYLLPDAAERLLYLDCDTLICGSLAPLLAFDLGGKTAAAVRDALTARTKTLLGFSPSEPYFNSGVLLIDTARWKAQQVTERVAEHAHTVRADYPFPDQDLFNLALRGDVVILPPACNLQLQHRLFADDTYFAAYPREGYYTAEELESARRAPLILHAYRFLGAFPWSRGHKHPDAAVWETLRADTPWRAVVPPPAERGALFTAERILYRLLPKRVFLRLFARIHGKKAAKQYQKTAK